jgi:hypothetical protein
MHEAVRPMSVEGGNVQEIQSVTWLRIPNVKRETKDKLIPIPSLMLPLFKRLVALAHPHGGYLCAAPIPAMRKSRGSEPGRLYMR